MRGATVYVPFLAMVTHPMGKSSKGRGVRGALAPTGTAPARLPPVALTEARALAEPKVPLRALMLPPLRALMLPPRALMLPPRALIDPLAPVPVPLALMYEVGEGARRGSAAAKTLRLLWGFSEAMLSDERSGATGPNGVGAVKLVRGSRRGVGLHSAPTSYVLSRVKQAGTTSSSASGSAGGSERAMNARRSPSSVPSSSKMVSRTPAGSLRTIGEPSSRPSRTISGLRLVITHCRCIFPSTNSFSSSRAASGATAGALGSGAPSLDIRLDLFCWAARPTALPLLLPARAAASAVLAFSAATVFLAAFVSSLESASRRGLGARKEISSTSSSGSA